MAVLAQGLSACPACIPQSLPEGSQGEQPAESQLLCSLWEQDTWLMGEVLGWLPPSTGCNTPQL